MSFPMLQNYFARRSIERTVVYPSHVHTDQKIEQSILDNVRAVLLDYLPNEIPYTITCEMEAFHFSDGKRSPALFYQHLFN